MTFAKQINRHVETANKAEYFNPFIFCMSFFGDTYTGICTATR